MDFREEYKKSAESLSPDNEAMERMKAAVLAKIAEEQSGGAAHGAAADNKAESPEPKPKRPLPLRRIAYVGGAAAACALITISAFTFLPMIKRTNGMIEDMSSSATAGTAQINSSAADFAQETETAMGEDDFAPETATEDGAATVEAAEITRPAAGVTSDSKTAENGSHSAEAEVPQDPPEDATPDGGTDTAVPEAPENVVTEPDIAEEAPADEVPVAGDDSGESDAGVFDNGAPDEEIPDNELPDKSTSADSLPDMLPNDTGNGGAGESFADDSDPAQDTDPVMTEEAAVTMDPSGTFDAVEETVDSDVITEEAYFTEEIGYTGDAAFTEEEGFTEECDMTLEDAAVETEEPEESDPFLVFGNGWVTFTGNRYKSDKTVTAGSIPSPIVRSFTNSGDGKNYHVKLSADYKKLEIYSSGWKFLGGYSR